MQVSDAGRLQSTQVRSADGKPLGRVGTVYVAHGARQPLMVAFPADRDTPFVAPLFGAVLTEDALVLGYSAEQVTAGPTVDAEALLSLGEIGAVLAYYGRPVRIDRPLTERMDGVGDVGFRDVQAVPRLPDIGDDDLPPIVVTRPAASG
ncbi:hypothetical protein AB0F81_29065 [Actinoplanes sp. NPDC024001]|uniref:hypothetical protein n=1 Tax=Actinoplanes sp. NPDC024001 TaxID=3154598 RepID=UPI0033EC8B9E